MERAGRCADERVPGRRRGRVSRAAGGWRSNEAGQCAGSGGRVAAAQECDAVGEEEGDEDGPVAVGLALRTPIGREKNLGGGV